MRTLLQTLQDHDRGHLSIVAELWHLDLPPDRVSQAAEQLSRAMLEATPQVFETLPGEARQVLKHLQRSGGRAPLETLVRQFGPLRYMGPGKRDRMLPWKKPVSPLEMLWYRGLMARAFADSAGGPQEFGFVPDDILARIPGAAEFMSPPLGEAAPVPGTPIPGGRNAVDDATTVLAAYRRTGRPISPDWVHSYLHEPEALEMLTALLKEAEILNDDPRPEPIRSFLQAARGDALALLQSTWRKSSTWNELAHTPGLVHARGDWPNDPTDGRLAALRLLNLVPTRVWWSLASFTVAVRDAEPDFMRPPGGFDSWYLLSADGGSSLRGFDHWDRVEAQYLTYLIAGPMHWLGLLDLSPDRSAFRLAASPDRPPHPIDGREDKESESGARPKTPSRGPTRGTAVARVDGRIRVSRNADRTQRYQIARLAAWEPMDAGAYHYRLTAESLSRAELQGLTAAHAYSLLEEISAPAGLLRALQRWSVSGAEAKVRQRMVLEVTSPHVLEILQNSSPTNRYLQETLGPTRVAIDPGDWPRLHAAALQIGLLIAGPDELLEERQ